MTSRNAGQSRERRFLPILLVFLAVLVVATGSLVGFSAAYAQRFPPGTRIGPVSVSGQNYLEALKGVQEQAEAFLEEGLKFTAGERTVTLEPAIGAKDEFSIELYDVDPETTVETAFAYSQAPHPIARLTRQVRSALFGQTVSLAMIFNERALRQALEDTFSKEEERAVNARLVINAKSLAVSLEPEQAGWRYDFEAAVGQAAQQVAQVDRSPIALAKLADRPTVTVADVERLKPTAEAALKRAPFTLTAEGRTFEVTTAQLAKALTASRIDGKIQLALDADQLAGLFDTMAKAVEVPVQEGRFRIADGRVVEFSQPQVGKELDRLATSQALAPRLTAGDKTVAAVVKEVPPKFTAKAASTLGITELVAQGKTNFTGSPPNRRFNIGVGAEKLNGLLIQPGEEFSLVKALGTIDGKHGFRQELVIKGDRTIPEYGGGLCQIGTTFFRLVLNTGLPVLERKNHSYRVRYYEPPVGMDATIYEPKPDFRFKNDYANPLLLQTHVAGDDLIFEFYGTKDGRQITTSTPKVFNLKPPPKKKTIETTDSKPGEVKCIERAHPGSDAEFTYTVVYPNGDEKKTVFKSHYRPWGEVCLVGVKKTSERKESGEDAER